jgi:pyruvate/2-oxoglutarate dehydrogenase complex dihydrolipoamide dehydrogenase (E3) component
MSRAELYDDLVLGSGAGGKLLAWHFGHAGQRVAVVERRWVGGSCPNIACLPSKNEVRSAEVADLLRRGDQFGAGPCQFAVDMTKVVMRKREMVAGLVQMHLDKFRASGAELIMGAGRFVAPKTIEVTLNGGGTRLLAGERVFIDVGTHAAIPPVPGLAESRPMTHIELLEVDRLPESLVVLGGGYVGLEFAQAYRRFGSRVTLIEHGPQLLSREDADVAEEVRGILAAEGIEILLNAEVVEVQGRSGEGVRLRVRARGGEQTIEANGILAATGRTPNTIGIGLDMAGVELDARGYIKVNDRLETSAIDVWAVGECAGSPQFTHAAEDDFRIVAENVADGNRSTRGRLIPYCLFTDPPLARVGLSERQARERGIDVRVARLPMTSVLRVRTLGPIRGFMKVLVEAAGDRILGFTMIGPEAGEVMAVVQIAMLGSLDYKLLRDTAVLAHPTMAEGLGSLFATVPAAPSAIARPPQKRAEAIPFVQPSA